MLIPVRCFTCNKVLGSLWEPYNELLGKIDPDTGKTYTSMKAMNKLGIMRYCCRKNIMSNPDLIETLNVFV